jgi:hypothetical protein
MLRIPYTHEIEQLVVNKYETWLLLRQKGQQNKIKQGVDHHCFLLVY